jgi:hypothetical protein
MVKYAFADAQDAFKRRGLRLLATAADYKNCTTKLRYVCNGCGKVRSVSLSVVLCGYTGCKPCGCKRGAAKNRKHDLGSARTIFEQHGLLLSESEYRSQKVPMRAHCLKCNYLCKISLQRVLLGEGCRRCSYQRRGQKRRHSISTVRMLFDQHDLEMLEDNYVGANAQMAYRCRVCGHQGKTRVSSLQSGNGCWKCGRILSASKNRRSLEEAADIFASAQMELREKQYKNNRVKMEYCCQICGHIGRINLHDVLAGRRCKACSQRNRTGPGHPRWIADRQEREFRRKIIEKCHGALRNALVLAGKKKDGTWKGLLGYTPTELREHIRHHRNWPQINSPSWHLDHVFPIKAFIDHGITDMRIINALDNLQPLSSTENRSKGYTYDTKKFRRYLQRKGYHIQQKREVTDAKGTALFSHTSESENNSAEIHRE